jgi:hypothetical protein
MRTFDPADPTAPPSRNPGWYADPVTDGRSERWWTGLAWSGYSRLRAAETPSPPDAPPVRPRNGIGMLSLLLGLLGLAVAGGALADGGHVWVSSFGILAIVLGFRAVRLRERRLATALLAPVVGIAAGALATLVTVALLLVPVSSPSRQPQDGVIGALPSAQAPMDPPASAPAAASSAVPLPRPTSTVLDAVPQQRIPDDALARYSAGRVRSVTSATAGCGVVRADEQAIPLDSARRTEARIAQDYLDLQLQAIRSALVYGPAATKPKTWPSSFDIDPETNVVFLEAPSCQPLGVLPKGDELRFGISPDHGQIAIAIWNADHRTGEIWRSVDDTEYAL